MSRSILLPSLALAVVLLSQLELLATLGLSALPLAIVFGMVAGHFSSPSLSAADQAVTCFCQKRCLRIGIVLFGLNLSFQQIATVGVEALVLNMIVISAVVAGGLWLGVRVLKLPLDTAILISAGSAICGAAAVLATDSAIKARQQQVTVAVATVVLFGTLAMFVYPLIFPYSQMSESAFGIYIGSTVHEVAQAVAAGESVGDEALDHAVVTKLMRVMLLAPFIVLLSLFVNRRNGAQGTPSVATILQTMPWFVLGFVCMAALNSVVTLPTLLRDFATTLSQFLLALAMVALGVQTRLSLIREAGIKPLLMALGLFLLLLVGGFFLNIVLV